MTTSTPNDNAFPFSGRYGLNSMDHSGRRSGAENDDLIAPNFSEAKRIFRALQLAANPGEDYQQVAAKIDREAYSYRDFLDKPAAIGKVILNVKQMGSRRADSGTVREQYHVVDPSEGQLDPSEGRASMCYTFNRSSSKVLEFLVCDEKGNPLFPIARAYASWLGEKSFDLGRNRKFYLKMFEDKPGYVTVHSGFVPHLPECASSQRRDLSSPRALDRVPWRRRILSGLTPFPALRALRVTMVVLFCAAVAAQFLMFKSALRNLRLENRSFEIFVTAPPRQSTPPHTLDGAKTMLPYPSATSAAMTVAGHSGADNFGHLDLHVRNESEALPARHLIYVQPLNGPDDMLNCAAPSISCHDLMAMLQPSGQSPAMQTELEHAAATFCKVMDDLKIVMPCKPDGQHGLMVYNLNSDDIQLLSRTAELDCNAKSEDVWLTSMCGASSATASSVVSAELNATIASTELGAGSITRGTEP